MKISKYITSEAVEIKRSQITFADYNPRKISDAAKKLLKDNIKRLGVMGGIVWNDQTNNLVGGHRKVEILDELHKYDVESHQNDYLIKVERVSLNSKEEREQNIFLNNKNAQGEYDNTLLSDIISDIDYKLAGLDEFDLTLAGINIPNLDIEQDFIDPFAQMNALEKIKTPADKKQDIQSKKDAVREKAMNDIIEGETYVSLVFRSHNAKAQFMQRLGLDPLNNIIQGEEFEGMIEVVM